MLRIDLTPLKQGIHQYTFDPEAGSIDLDPEQFSDIEVEVQLDYQNDRALLVLQATATATLECDRTLQMYEQEVNGAYQMLFAPPHVAETYADEEAGHDDEIHVLHPSDQYIDITEAVRDTLLLALPVRRVAPGVEDLDLQTVYGAPVEEGKPAIDPRWEALRKLQAGDDEAA